jgi:uncharacterized protein YdhG (YjbR/CyaY superfamily)
MSPQTKATTPKKRSDGFTEEERAAMRERVKEIKASSRRGSRASKADGESDVLAKIAEMPKSDCILAEGIHKIIRATAPDLTPRTWYGMPAYAKEDKVLCYFQSAQKFKSRYATLGFSDKASLDDGDLWPTVYAVKELTSEVKAQIARLVEQAVA